MSPARVRRDIAGRIIRGVSRRGKVLFFELSRSGKAGLERVMAVHLRMSGSMELADKNSYPSSLSSSSRRWTHFLWKLSGGRELRFVDPRKFGLVWYGAPDDLMRDRYIASLGLDAKNLSAKEFARAFKGRRGMIKSLLLRQDIIAGIGNIIADEALWKARIHPKRNAAALDAEALLRLGKAVSHTISSILSSGGTSMRNFRHPDGNVGSYQERRLVYGNAGKPCPRCRGTLRRIVVGGRGTTICPSCQRTSS